MDNEIEIDINRLLLDEKYAVLLTEYHSFTGYIISEFNRRNQTQTLSSSIKFHKESKVNDIKGELIDMLKNTFPKFEVSIERYSDYYDLDEDEYSIKVSWKNFK